MTTQLVSQLLSRGAMGEGDVVVCDVVEEVDLILLQHQRRGDGVDWSIAPSLVEETAILVERCEVVDISLGPQPLQATDFEVGPLNIC